jgi:hypothetical protein
MHKTVVTEEVAGLALLLTSVLTRNTPEIDEAYIENAMLHLAAQLLAVTMAPDGIYYQRQSDRLAIRKAFNLRTRTMTPVAAYAGSARTPCASTVPVDEPATLTRRHMVGAI